VMFIFYMVLHIRKHCVLIVVMLCSACLLWIWCCILENIMYL
jgi:hypothetical protein